VPWLGMKQSFEPAVASLPVEIRATVYVRVVQQ
jgi:hypothetical protein